ncbi:MAG: NADPH-dependent F420 reductase, partial [Gemmatimonadales bacterium]
VQFYATDDQAAGDAVADLIRTAGYAPALVGGIGQSIRIEAFGDLHETTLGAAVTEEEAKKLI